MGALLDLYNQDQDRMRQQHEAYQFAQNQAQRRAENAIDPNTLRQLAENERLRKEEEKKRNQSNLQKIGSAVGNIAQDIGKATGNIISTTERKFGINAQPNQGPSALQLVQQARSRPDNAQIDEILKQYKNPAISAAVLNNAAQGKSIDELKQIASQTNNQIIKENKKLAGDLAVVGSVVVPGGAGIRAATTATKLARPVLTSAASGYAGGVGYELSQNPDQSILNAATSPSAVLGALGGAALPLAGAGVRRLRETTIPTITETRLGQKAAQTTVGKKITNLKDSFVAKIVDDTNFIKKPFIGLTDNATGRKITEEIEDRVTNVRQFAGLAQDRLQNNQAFQGLRTLIGGSKQAYEDFGNFIKQKQNAINAQKVGRPQGKIPTGTPEQEQAYALLNQSTKDDVQYLFDNGIIDQAKYDRWIDDPNYTRVQREVNDDLGQQFGGGLGSASTVTTQKLKGSTKEAIDPFASYEDWQRKVTLEVERNKLRKYIRDQSLDKGIVTPLRQADDVIERMQLYGEATQLRPLRNKLGKIVRTQNKYLNRIQSELDKLNKQGLDEYLKSKPSPQREIDLASTSRVIRQGETDDALKLLRQQKNWKTGEAPAIEEVRSKMYGSGYWNQATNEPTQRLKAYATKNKLSVDDALINQYMKKQRVDEYTNNGQSVILSRSKVNKKAAEMIANGETSSQVLGVTSTGSKMTTQKTRAAVDNLIQTDTSKLEAIRRKIANREPKLAQAIDELTTIKNDYSQAKNEVNNLVQRARSLSDLDPNGEQTLKVFEKGIKELYTIDPKAARQLASSADLELKNIANWVLFPSRVLRGGATSLNVAFAVPNFIRDQVSSAIISPNARATHNPIAFWAGLKEAVLKPTFNATVGKTGIKKFEPSPLFKEYLKRNANMTQVDLARNLKDATRQAQENLGVRGESLIRRYENIISATEKATRYQSFMGIYKNAVKKGIDPEQALRRASAAARTNSVNFANRGEIARFAKIFNPYFNASVQGSKTIASAIKNRPIGTSMKIGATILSPVALSTYYNLSDPERAEIYARLPDYVRNGNLIMVLGDNRGYIKVPLPPGIREFSKPLRNYIESEYLGDRQGFLETAKNLVIDPFSPIGTTGREVLSQAIPQAVKPPLEIATNQEFYTGNKIIPDNLKDLPPEEQVFGGTPEIYRNIGKVLDMSPLQVRKIITGYGAGGAEGAITTVGMVAGQDTGGYSSLEQIKKRFTSPAPSDTSNEVVSKFYETYTPLQSEKNSISKKITEALKVKDYGKANTLANQINDEIEKQKNRLRETYGKFETDLSVLYDKFDSLKFPVENGQLKQSSIDARLRQ